MRRILIVVMALIMVLSFLSSCEKGEQVAFMSDYDNRSGITVSELCASQKKISVGFIGGSITEADKYRVYVMEYLRKTYPDNIFEEICAGVGGTGSVLGVVRIEHDLLVHTPDIVFIEFSVNDGSDSPSHRIAMEGMIRKVLRKNGGTIVSVLGTATVGTFADYDNGNLPGAVFAHKEVAEYYNIPYINVGEVLYKHIRATGDPATDYLPDNVHPNYEGGKVYAEEIIRYLEDYEWNINFKDEPMTDNTYENADLFYASDYIQEPWTGVPGGGYFGNKYPNYIMTRDIGATLEFDFYGRYFGMYHTLEGDTGTFEYRIDGGDWHKVVCWDEYCLDFESQVCLLLKLRPW